MGKHKKGQGQPPGDYEVGYKKPPVRTRWRPNQSGNPDGNLPKPPFDLIGETISAIEGFFGSELVVDGPNGPQKIQGLLAMVQRQGIAGINDAKAAQKLIQLYLGLLTAHAARTAEAAGQVLGGDDDLAVLEAQEARIARRVRASLRRRPPADPTVLDANSSQTDETEHGDDDQS